MRPSRLSPLFPSLWFLLSGVVVHAQLPPVPVPAENPLTAEKAVLGKMLFWDEQLSSDDSVACGTCHDGGSGGHDARIGVNPGLDGIFNTADDVLGSPGVIHADENNFYESDPVFGLGPQVTGRAAPAAVGAAWAPELFWDGRASSSFENPETGQVSIANRGALESQAVGPLLSSVEMAHEGRTWAELTAKLETIEPLELASDLPPDVASALAADPGYPELFEAAFGDGAITAERIAFAIASYERTLVPDETPWDAFVAGNGNALTPGQRAGLQVFQNTTCTICHRPPFFTDNSFRNVGLRPIEEDEGRVVVTGVAGDRGRFKVPTLRNAALSNRFMHNGRLASMRQVVDFYLEANGQVQFPENQDPLVQQIVVPPQAVPALVDFLENGLTDPRVAARSFPFDQPRLSASVNACRDGIDNDGDGLVDFAQDPGCASEADTTERTKLFTCDDGLDNDRDGVTDLDDPDCSISTNEEDGDDAPGGGGGCAQVGGELAMLPPGLWLFRRRRRS